MTTQIRPRTTIDDFGIEEHQRYAKNQEDFEVRYITEAPSVPEHVQIAGTSTIYPSALDELLGISHCKITWALFEPPPGYSKQSNRFFTSHLFRGSSQKLDSEVERDPHIEVLIEEIDHLDSLILYVQSRILQFRRG